MCLFVSEQRALFIEMADDYRDDANQPRRFSGQR